MATMLKSFAWLQKQHHLIGAVEKQLKENQIEKSSGNLYADFKYKNPEEMQIKANLAYVIYIIIKHKKLTQTTAIPAKNFLAAFQAAML